jgi:hypothetical protein
MNEPQSTSCSQWEEKLAALHPDDLSPIELDALKAHIAECPACEAMLADYYELRDLMRRTLTTGYTPGIWKLFVSPQANQDIPPAHS